MPSLYCSPIESVVDRGYSGTEHTKKIQTTRTDLLLCPFVHKNSHTDWPGAETVPSQ